MAQQPNDSGEKSWERPWSTEEIRQNADKWNLAADAGLLKHLQQFSQVVLNHTHSTEKALDSLLETINTTNTNINNVTNNFLCLANTQFLESRVYDDDESPQEAPAANVNQVAQADGDVMTKVRSALSVGINLLETMFDPVDQNTSGVENDFLGGVRNRSLKNPYANRPLPYLIGSTAFMGDDNVGLIIPEREPDQPDQPDQPSAKAPTMDDLSMYSDESILTSSAKRTVDDDSSNSFRLGDETPIQSKKPPRDAVSVTDLENDIPEARSFADELAGKLAGMISPESKLPVSAHGEHINEETVTQNRPSKEIGDMFGVPHSDDEEDDALFSGRSGLFSGGRGLFDDLDNKPTLPREETKEKSISVSSTQAPPSSKVETDLFGSNSADEESDDLFAVSAKKEPVKPAKPLDVPPRPLSIGDVISQAARRNVSAPPPLLGEGDAQKKRAETVPTLPDSSPPPMTSEKRIPVGGKSMFGSAGLGITKEALRRRPSSSSSSSGDSDDGVRGQKAVQNNLVGVLPRSPDEDDLFQPVAAIVNQKQQSATLSITQNQSKILPQSRSGAKEFSPESPGEDDLFATPKNSTNILKRAENDKSVPEDDDDLFAVRKGGNDMFGRTGNDTSVPAEDDLFATPKSGSDFSRRTEVNKSVPPEDDLFAEPKTSSDIFKKLEAKSAAGEDDLFATPKSSSDIFRGPEDNKPVLSAPKTKSSIGLFDAEGSSDEDNLFNPRPLARQSLFSSVPPPLNKPEEKSKKVSLFDDSDSGDDEFLFSSASSAGSRRSQASVEVFNSSSVPVLTDKMGLKKGLFDDDNLFSSPLDGPDIDIFRDVGNDSALPTKKIDTPISATGASTTATKNITSTVESGTSVSGANTAGLVKSATNATNISSASTIAVSPPSSISVKASICSTIPGSGVVLPDSSSAVVPTTGSAFPSSAVPPPISNSAYAETSGFVVPPPSSNSDSPPTGSSISGSAVPPPNASSASPPTGSAISGIAVPPPIASSAGPSTESAALALTVPSTDSPLLNSNAISASLFDDDEDLFSVSSKPQPPQKPSIKDIKPQINNFTPSITENMFSGLENHTKDSHSRSDGLFDNIPGDDLFVEISPSLVSDPVNSEPRSRMDELFGTEEGDGDLFVPKKPTLTISDPTVEDKSEGTITKEPSVVDTVPNKQESIIKKKIDSKPALPARPPRTLDIRNTTDPSVISSFDDDDESEDLFKILPVGNKPPSQTEKIPESLPKPGLQPKPSQMDEPGIVERPQSSPAPVDKPRKLVPMAQKPSFSSDENGGAQKPRPPEVLPKPDPRKDEADETVPVAALPPIRGKTPLAGFALNINPLALLPGAQPPSKKTPGEEPVGFDQPIENTATLHSAQKDRVRGSKRRPPSRRARQEAAKVVDHTGVNITSPSSALSPSTDEDDLFGVPQDLPPDSGPFDGPQGPFDRAPILSPAEPLAAGLDKVDPVPVDDPLLKMRVETSSETETETEADATEDHSSLFAFVKKKPKETQPESLFSQAPPLPTKDDLKRVSNDLTVDDVEDDGLFKPSSAVKKITELGSGTKTWNLSDDDDDDDLFSTGVSSMKRGIMNSSEKMRSEEKKPTEKSEPSRVTKISQQAPRKTEKPLFDDDDDDLDDGDLFTCASNKPPPLPVPKAPAGVTKKSSSTSLFKDDLFDDPLSGL